MKKLPLLTLYIFLSAVSLAQFVAKMEVKKPIKGICNDKEVYVMFPMFKGQTEAKCPLSDKEINKRLKEEVSFLKDSSRYDDKGMVNIIINCKGEVVQCEMDNKTRNPELDKQIVAVFNSLGEWKAARLGSREVDSSRLWSVEIKEGQISLK